MDAKGRNGYFKVAKTYTFTANGEAWVEVYSKQVGRSAPLVLAGSVDEVLQWLKNTAAELENRTVDGNS